MTVSMKAGRRLTTNIRARLKAAGLRQTDLAFYCRRSKPWVTRLLQDKHKKIAFFELDCIADLFDCDVADLFQPERRRSKVPYTGPERRAGKDRREH